MDGYQYERKCAELLKAMGFSKVQVTPGSGDQGIDVIAYRSKKKYGVQCKYYDGTVGNKAIQEVYAGVAYYNCDVALVITNSTLTRPAKELASKLKVEVWENIDAIYLQKHTAEYIEREKVLHQQEKKRQQQLEKEEQRKRELALKEQQAHKKRQQEEAKKVAKLRPRYDYASGLIASSTEHIVVVKSDGTVAAVGKNDYGQCNVSGWRDVIAVQCDRFGTVGVTSEGTVYYSGTNLENQDQCRRWTGIKAAGTTGSCVYGLRYDGTVITTRPEGLLFGNSVDKWSGVAQLRFGITSEVAGITHDHKLFKKYHNTQNIDDIAIGFDGWDLILKMDGSVQSIGGSLNSLIEPTQLNKQYGIVKIYMYFKRPLAILSDGSIFLEPMVYSPSPFQESGLSSFQKYTRHNTKFTTGTQDDELFCFLANNKIDKVVAFCTAGSLSVLTEDGKVYWLNDAGYGSQPFGDAFRAFSDFHKMMDEKEATERKIREAKKLAEKAQREEEQRRIDRRSKGLCQYCGGSLKKAFWGMKCTSCGKRKDY